MGFQMSSVDHQLLWLAPFRSQLGQNPVEHAEPAPPDEAVVDRLVRAILLRSVTPPQPVAQNKDDASKQAGHQRVARRATAENTARCDASAPPTKASNHSSQRLRLTPVNQNGENTARTLIDPEPRSDRFGSPFL